MSRTSLLKHLKRGIARFKRWLHGPRVDEPLAYERYGSNTASGAGTVMELFRNRLGSILLAASVSTGSVAAQYDYDSFGTRVETGTEQQRYGFTGREHDAESGLVHYRARIYDPALGQFLQRDPIGFAAGDLNLYAYTWNDPWNWSDPSGLNANVENTALERQKAAMRAAAVGAVSKAVNSLATRIAQELMWGISKSDSKPGAKPSSPNTDSATNSDDYAGAIEEMARLKEAIKNGDVQGFVYHRKAGTDEKMAVLTTGMLGRSNMGRQGSGAAVEAFLGPLPAGVPGYSFTTPALPTGATNRINGTVIQWGEGAPGTIDVPGFLNAIPVTVID